MYFADLVLQLLAQDNYRDHYTPAAQQVHENYRVSLTFFSKVRAVHKVIVFGYTTVCDETYRQILHCVVPQSLIWISCRCIDANESLQRSGYCDSSDLGPRNYNMIHDNVANEGGSRLIRESLGDRHRARFRRESTGDELDTYHDLLGSENGRTMGNAAARNREYRRHRVESFDIWDEPAYGMQLNMRT